jgi:TrmH family RNA methyltransferase
MHSIPKNRVQPPIVIFVRPQAPGNIGALARVMSNFGATELRLVGSGPTRNPSSPDDPFQTMDWALARRGDFILEKSIWYESLQKALSDTQLAIGSSGRDIEFERGYARPFVNPIEAYKTVLDWQKQTDIPLKWALVMGPEDDGLNESESALCQKLIRVPTSTQNSSLNIAMAAGILLYTFYVYESFTDNATLSHDQDSGAFLKPDRNFARLPHTEAGREKWSESHHKEDFLNYLMDTISYTQFLKYPDQDSVKARIRRWLQSAPIPLGELLFAFEILYHLKSWGTGKFEARDFLKSKRTR